MPFKGVEEKAAESEPTGSDERVGDRRKFPPLTPQNSKVVRAPLEHQTFIESPVHPVNEKLYYLAMRDGIMEYFMFSGCPSRLPS